MFIVGEVFLEIKFPVLAKWTLGSARMIGKPINATVYTNGRLNSDITVYREKNDWDGNQTNDYLLKLKRFDKYGMLAYITIDLNRKWIGRPISTAEAAYKVICGYLFQSDVSYHNADFRDDIKGFNFDPHLAYSRNEIKFNLPAGWLQYDSITIELTKQSRNPKNQKTPL